MLPLLIGEASSVRRGCLTHQISTYVAVLRKMYETPAWEKVRLRNGWEDLFKPGKEFSTFLEGQEKVIGELMDELGFLK